MQLPTTSGLDNMTSVTAAIIRILRKNATSGSQYTELPGFNMLIS